MEYKKDTEKICKNSWMNKMSPEQKEECENTCNCSDCGYFWSCYVWDEK
uniref:Uncharacterized protein n=1 Tax=viral metagenome TaxID=1070528 RepID=A0A6C0EP00_9ZZZZ